MSELLIVLSVVFLSCALRSFQWGPVRKLGAAGLLVASFLVGYFITGRFWVGSVAVLLWFVFPWFELLTRTRRMRLPVKKSLSRKAPPGAQRFPELTGMTEEIENEGFEYVSDTGWEWEDTHQFFRFFYSEEKRTQAAICFTEQGPITWASVSVTSRTADKIRRTINVSFSNPMKNPPNVEVRRDLESTTFREYLAGHLSWLETCGYQPGDLQPQSPRDILSQVERESGQQISHNVDSGIIALCEEAETWRYSWRGLCFLYFQVLKDFLRWC